MKQNKLFLARAICSSLALCLVVAFSFYAFLSSANAWFAFNADVDGNGMRISARSLSDLIISDDPSDVTNASSGSGLAYVSFTGTGAYLEPATHDEENGGLKRVKTTDNINPLTGMAKTSSVLDYEEAEAGVNYAEFTAYVNVASSPLGYTNFRIALDPSACFAACADGETASGGTDYYSLSDGAFVKASLTEGASAQGYFTQKFDGIYLTASVDLLYEGEYLTTLHPSDFSSGPVTYTISPSGTLDPASPVSVTLRVYFDGAMVAPGDASGKTILRAANQRANLIYLGFLFSIDPVTNA